MLAVALADQGFDVHAVIWSEPQRTWQEFEAVVVRSCWDYHLRLHEFLGWIARLEHSGVAVLNSPDLIRWNANKIYLAELAAAGITMPDTIFVEPGMELDLARVCASRGWPSAVVKPTISASAHCTERRFSGLVRGPAMVQQYIAAVETEGEWSLVYFNRQFSHSVIKTPRAGDFRVQTAFGGTVRAAQPSRELLRFAESVLDKLVWPAAFARVDVIADGPAIRLMELEVIEPELFLDMAPGSGGRLAFAIRDLLSPACVTHKSTPSQADVRRERSL